LILLAQLLIFLLALAGVAACSLAMIFFAGGAMNRARPREYRLTRTVYAALCLIGLVASAAAGFVGVGAIMYWAGR
jgi:hypothetical protein